MPRNLDTREFSYVRSGADPRPMLEGFAAAISYELPGDHVVEIGRVNPWTGSAGLLKSRSAPRAFAAPSNAIAAPTAPIAATRTVDLIDRAIDHVRVTSAALGFAASETPELVPDPTVNILSGQAGYVVHLYQQYRGIPVFQMERMVRFDVTGAIVDVAGSTVGLPNDVSITAVLSLAEAARAAVAYLAKPGNAGQTDGFKQPLLDPGFDASAFTPTVLASFTMPSMPTVLSGGTLFPQAIPAHLTLFYTGPTTRLGWHFLITLPDFSGQYVVIVAADATTADILYAQQTSFSATATAESALVVVRGNVFEHNPGAAGRKLVPFPRAIDNYPFDPPRSQQPDPQFPRDWCDQSLRATSGNCTVARLATATGPLAEPGTGDLVFDPTDPEGNDQKVLNIFYFCCYMHDFFYMLGFDERFNFQQQDFTGSGLGGDPVDALAYPVPVKGTANMMTLADGQRALMNMGPFASTNRHTALDSDVVFHEFTHGVSNRLVGGRLDANALQQPQSRGMGEGWSDYFALSIQNAIALTNGGEEKTVIGDWVADDPTGIRSAPYDSAFPGSFGDISSTGGDEHDIGEIWCATLIQMNRNLGTALGSRTRGHELGWQIVVDGMKATPANPGFIDARDAIAHALTARHAAQLISDSDYVAAWNAIWTAFIQFGIGPNAASVGASLSGIVEDTTSTPPQPDA